MPASKIQSLTCLETRRLSHLLIQALGNDSLALAKFMQHIVNAVSAVKLVTLVKLETYTARFCHHFILNHPERSSFAAAPGSERQNVTLSLLLLKATLDPTNVLSWSSNVDYCSWQGIQCNARGLPVSL